MANSSKSSGKASKQEPKQPPQTQQDQPGDEHEMTPEPVSMRDNYVGSRKLDGRVALITGGDSGIGRAVALHFAAEGADVAIVYYDEEVDAKETADRVRNLGRRCELIKGDLASAAFCRKAVEQTVSKLERLDVLVNNAAVQFPKDSIAEIDEKDLDRTFRVNIYAMFFLTAAALPHLEKSGKGCIVNTTSVTAYRGSQELIDYSSTKGAIVSFTRSLSGQLAKKNIRVNAVAPGPIWTPLIPATFDEEKVATFGSDVPMGRPGQPAEVATAFVFLASDDASYMTGQVLHVNGGEIING